MVNKTASLLYLLKAHKNIDLENGFMIFYLPSLRQKEKQKALMEKQSSCQMPEYILSVWGPPKVDQVQDEER